MAHRDRVGGSSGRRKGAGDAVHRQNFSTPSDGPHTRPQRRLAKAFGRRRARFAMPRISTLLAENLGQPSLWVMINAPWYYIATCRRVPATAERCSSASIHVE